MKRQVLLGSLVAVLALALYWLLLFKPAGEEIAALQSEQQSLEQQEQLLAVELTRLEDVRRRAPELEAELLAARAVVPEEAALPSVVRQLQSAADEAGIELVSVSPSRPAHVTAEGGPVGLASIAVAVDVEGSYFQVIDFLRRLEDPAISPRGLLWNSMSLSSAPETYPVLTVTFQGEVFALVPIAEPDVSAAEPETAEPPVGAETTEPPVGAETTEPPVEAEPAPTPTTAQGPEAP